MASGGDESPYRALPSSSSRLPIMGYDLQSYVNSLGWTAIEFGADAQDCNILHVHSHGNSSFIWSDSNDYWYEYLGWPPDGNTQRPPTNIYGGSTPIAAPTGSINLYDQRVAANGSGLPPFNSTGKPPINLAYIGACSAAVDNTFADGTLYPYGNAFTGVSSWPENQSCVGYALSFKSNQTRAVNEAFWEHVKETYTVTEARVEAFDAYQGSNKPSYATDFMHVWGDYYTRLKGVYTGTAGQAPGWHT